MAGHPLAEGHEATVGESANGDRMMNRAKVVPMMVNLGPNAQMRNARMEIARKEAVESQGQEADSETGPRCLEEAAINHSPC
jgi:hypothetical protein